MGPGSGVCPEGPAHAPQCPPSLFLSGPGLTPPDKTPHPLDAFAKAGREDICLVSGGPPVSAPEVLGQSQGPSPSCSPQPQIVSWGKLVGSGRSEGQRGSWGSLPRDSQGAELKRWRKAKDYSDRGVQKLRPRFASAPSV